MSSDLISNFGKILGEYFPSLLRQLNTGEDNYQAIAGAMEAFQQGSLSWARLNQTLHRLSEAGMSEGFFRYYFLEVPQEHPYPVELVFHNAPFRPPKDAHEIVSVEHLQWGIRRFIYDAMLYWGNFHQAYRDLRQLTSEQLLHCFAAKRVDEGRMTRRGKVQDPTPIPRDHRYLISEMACKTYETAPSLEETRHVKLALQAFRTLKSEGREITPKRLKKKTQDLAEGAGQSDLFELMYEDAGTSIQTEAEVVSLYSGQLEAFQLAREKALENTRIYLSSCNDLDVYYTAPLEE